MLYVPGKGRNALGVTVVLTAFLKMFGLARTKAEYPLHQRQLDLSGNVVMFSMSENFSRDFPADDMVTVVELDDPRAFSQGWVVVLQRYWDFRSDGVFGRNMGTLQMTMGIKKLEESQKLDITNKEEFIKVIYLELENTYASFNANKPYEEQMLYSNLEGDFVEFMFNNQRWIRYSTWKEGGRDLTSMFAIPIVSGVYLTVAFAFAPAINVGLRPFIHQYAQPHIDRMMDTFFIKYSIGNPVSGELENASGRN